MDRIQITVGGVLQILDALTGKPLTERQTPVIEWQGKPPLKKQEGYYILLQPFDAEGTIRIQAMGCQEQVVKLEEIKKKHNVKVYMRPIQDEFISSQFFGLSGKGQPSELLAILCQQNRRQGGLQQQVSIGEEKIRSAIKASVPMEEEKQYTFHWIRTDESGAFFWYHQRRKGEASEVACEIWTPEGEKLGEAVLQAGKLTRVGNYR